MLFLNTIKFSYMPYVNKLIVDLETKMHATTEHIDFE